MEEQNATKPEDKSKSTENAKKNESAKGKKTEGKMSFSETVQDYKAEFHKIIWPKRDEVFKKTGTVIITSLIVGAVIFCMDTIYTSGYDLLLSLLTK